MLKKSKTPRKVFIETSVFIRFLTNDDPQKAAECHKLFELVERGAVRPYISNVVILEIVFVLERLYGFARADVLNAVEKVLELRNITLIEKTNTCAALEHWRARSIKYGDCLIASQVPHGIPIITYDADFKKLGGHVVFTPAGVVA